MCLLSDPDMLPSTLLQVIRHSLRSTAQMMLATLGVKASADTILRKLDSLFGHFSTNGIVMQEFFNSFHKALTIANAFYVLSL